LKHEDLSEIEHGRELAPADEYVFDGFAGQAEALARAACHASERDEDYHVLEPNFKAVDGAGEEDRNPVRAPSQDARTVNRMIRCKTECTFFLSSGRVAGAHPLSGGSFREREPRMAMGNPQSD
jgi:hypothetical protein